MLDRRRFDALRGERSAKAVAEAAGVSSSHLSEALSGRKGFSVENLAKLADNLGCTMDYLAGRTSAAACGVGQQEAGSPGGTDVPHMEAGEAEDVATEGMGAAATRGEVDLLRRQVADLIGEVALLKASVAELRRSPRVDGSSGEAGGG